MICYHFRRLVIGLFALVYLADYFFHSPAAAYIYRILLVLVVIQGLARLPRINFLVSAGLFALGGMLLLMRGGTWQDWLTALSGNAGLMVLFIVVPLLGAPFFYGDYESQLKKLIQTNIGSVALFSLLVFVITHILGIIISVGAVPLIYGVFIGSARYLRAEKAFVKALLRGYVTTGFWSPIWASMAAVTSYLKLSWVSLIPYGLLCAAVALAIFLLFQYLETLRSPGLEIKKEPSREDNIRRPALVAMLALFFSLIVLIILFDIFTSWQLLIIIPLVSLLFPLASAVVMRKLREYRAGLVQYYQVSILKTNNEVILFAAAGFLGKALEMSGIGGQIPRLIPAWLSQYPLATALAICILMMLFSLTGIHPVVTGSSLLGTIDPAALHLSPLVFGLIILFAWAECILISPFSATNLIVSGLTGEPCWRVSLGNNALYGLALLVTIPLLIIAFA